MDSGDVCVAVSCNAAMTTGNQSVNSHGANHPHCTSYIAVLTFNGQYVNIYGMVEDRHSLRSDDRCDRGTTPETIEEEERKKIAIKREGRESIY